MEDLTTQNHLNIISAKWYGEQKITETNIIWETQSHWKKKKIIITLEHKRIIETNKIFQNWYEGWKSNWNK